MSTTAAETQEKCDSGRQSTPEAPTPCSNHIVYIVSCTSNSDVINQWLQALKERDCEIRIISPDECQRTMPTCPRDTRFLIDNVDPKNSNGETARLARLLHGLLPRPRVVVLVSEEDSDGLWKLCRANPWFWLHHHSSDGALDRFYDFLAGKRVDTPFALRASTLALTAYTIPASA